MFSIRTGGAALCALAISMAHAQTKPADSAIPHLEKRGLATQLIVDGKPFLVLGAEPPTSGASNLEYLKHMLQVNAETHQNTADIAVGWNWLEPEKGRYDFKILDALIEDARVTNQRICLVWFGSWKNGVSSFVPTWIKADYERFPREQTIDAKTGVTKTAEALSPFADSNWQEDARALAAVMRHIREADRTHRVILVQAENEIGIFGDSRDRSAAANKVFNAPVPAELMDYLQKHKDDLHPDLRKVWEAAGAKTSGTWEEVFGKGPEGGEIFMAWGYARYINHVIEAGKKEYPVPMFVNQWGTIGFGKGPRGEAFDHVHDIWKVGGPLVDFYCPDAYMGGSNPQGVANHIVDLTQRYTRSGKPFFTTEAMDGDIGAAHAFFAIGQERAIGYSGMGNDGLLQWFTHTGINLPGAVTEKDMDSPDRLVGFGGPGTNKPLPPLPREYEAKSLSQGFLTLSQIAPQILEHQAKGTIAAAVLDKGRTEEKIKLGNYTLNVTLPRGRRTPEGVPDIIGYGVFMPTGPDEYLLAGNNLLITFTPDTPGPAIAGLAMQEAGRFDSAGKWVTTHFLGGDDTLMSSEPPVGQSGSAVRLEWGEHAVQRVKLYRFQ